MSVPGIETPVSPSSSRVAGAVPFFSAKAKHTAVSSAPLLLFSQGAGAVDATTEAAPTVSRPGRSPLLDQVLLDCLTCIFDCCMQETAFEQRFAQIPTSNLFYLYTV